MKALCPINRKLDKLYLDFCRAEFSDCSEEEYELLALLLYRIGTEWGCSLEHFNIRKDTGE